MDLDAELDRRRQAVIADPNSNQFQASTRYAELCAAKHGWSYETTRIYALFVRSVDLPKPRPVTVALVDTKARERVNVQVTHCGPGAPPDGFATFLPANIDPWLVLGMTPPGLQPKTTLTYSPLTMAPSQVLSP
jgi:hypothetical protein